MMKPLLAQKDRTPDMFRKLPFLLLAALLLGGLPPSFAASGGGESEHVAGQPTYLPLEPAFVVNVQDASRRRPRFMQVTVQVMTREPKVSAAIEENMPPIRDAMIMLLAHQDGGAMATVEGREKVRLEAQSAIQHVLAEIAGLQTGVEAVYFTDFVIQ